MSLIRKSVKGRKEGVGDFVAFSVRFPFWIFLGKPVRYGFRPHLSGASWYEILPPADPLEVLDMPNAFAAMAYLRKCDPDLKPLHLR